ncbi:hypothetical protein LR69_00365 [Geobacillus sp. BCO2]|nr:hypothetical protein LR69_00365 [Geobacillus sp. BCO2]
MMREHKAMLKNRGIAMGGKAGYKAEDGKWISDHCNFDPNGMCKFAFLYLEMRSTQDI